MEHIEALDATLPNANPDLNNSWVPIILNLHNVPNAPDVFHIAFCLTDNFGTNGVTYLLDDVTWNLPVTGIEDIQQTHPKNKTLGRKFFHGGQLYIVREGRIYNALGAEVTIQ